MRRMDGGRILKAGGSVFALMGLVFGYGRKSKGRAEDGRGRKKYIGYVRGLVYGKTGPDIIAGWYTGKHGYAPVTSYNGHISYLDTSTYKCILNAEKGLNGAYTALQGEHAEIKAVRLYRVKR